MAGDPNRLEAGRDSSGMRLTFVNHILPGASDSLTSSIRGVDGDPLVQFEVAAEIGKTLRLRPGQEADDPTRRLILETVAGADIR